MPKSRIVFPDGNQKEFNSVLPHREGDPLTYENTNGEVEGYTVQRRLLINDKVFILADRVIIFSW